MQLALRKTAFLALLLTGLVSLFGCATPERSAYGNFTESAPAAMHKTVANDAVKQLVVLYPPATTRLDLQQATPDAFGSLLVESLRAKGYALLEFKPGSTTAASQDTGTGTDRAAGAGKPLRYILDQLDANLYRVTLLVGNESLTRAYLAANSGTLHPAGAWVRKE
jgi:hypothetical protein